MAIKVPKSSYSVARETIAKEPDFSRYGAIVFGDADDGVVSSEERNYVREILGTGEDESILMSAGRIDESEEILTKIGDSSVR